MLKGAKFAVGSEIYTKHINTCGHNVQFPNIKPRFCTQVLLDFMRLMDLSSAVGFHASYTK